MTEQCKKRIGNIINQYHPVLEPGEKSITYEEAERMVEWLLGMEYDEDQAMDFLKYCTVGSDFVEGQPEEKADLSEKVDEACFYSRMAMQKAGHAGLLGMAVYVAGRARGKGKWEKATKGIILGSMVLLVLDEVEVLVRAVKHLIRANEKI
ncbi:MAG: hypothetical protein LUE87_08385 [Lachnospiraceae bacterium]|nr:hypothetical protein [Lachnospiraceae bacterium]